MRPIPTRFGIRAPRLVLALDTLSKLWGETIVPAGGDAANWLGLTTQNPVRSEYLTSGPDCLLHFGAHQVELRYAPRWQLTAPHRTAGVVIRVIVWLGLREVEDSLDAVLPKLPGRTGSTLRRFSIEKKCLHTDRDRSSIRELSGPDQYPFVYSVEQPPKPGRGPASRPGPSRFTASGRLAEV